MLILQITIICLILIIFLQVRVSKLEKIAAQQTEDINRLIKLIEYGYRPGPLVSRIAARYKRF